MLTVDKMQTGFSIKVFNNEYSLLKEKLKRMQFFSREGFWQFQVVQLNPKYPKLRYVEKKVNKILRYNQKQGLPQINPISHGEGLDSTPPMKFLITPKFT